MRTCQRAAALTCANAALLQDTMAHYTSYTYEQLLPCANTLLAASKAQYNGTAVFKAVKGKYSVTKFEYVSSVEPVAELYRP